MLETFGSAVHGAGRLLSRKKALKTFSLEMLMKEMGRKGIVVRGHTKRGLLEEAPGAYKDIEEVVEVMHETGINKKVARLRPLIVVKG